MSIIKIFKAWFCLAWLPMMFDSESSSSTANTTNNIDQRVLLEKGGVAGSASGGSSVSITTLDGGAIHESFGLGAKALDNVTDLATASMSASHHTAELALNGALHSLEYAQAGFRKATDEVATAYEDAKVGNRSTMTMGLFIIGAVLVAFVFKK